MENTTLPQELIAAIGSENKDFAVKADRAQPLKKSIFTILFGTCWTAFTSIFVFVFLGPLLRGEEVHFTSNGTEVVAGPGNLGPIVVPAILIGLFVLIGIGMLGWGIFSLFKKGGYFVGTPSGLINFQNGNMRSIDWEQFSGDIKVSGNTLKGDITLQMRTGKMVNRKNGPDRFVPDVIYIAGVQNAFEIEKICRKRIKENDTTPPTAGGIIS